MLPRLLLLMLLLMLLLVLLVAAALRCMADGGYQLRPKYNRVADASRQARYQAATQLIAFEGKDAVLQTAATELRRGLQGLAGQPVPLLAKATTGSARRGLALEIAAPANASGSLQNNPEGSRIFTRGPQLVVAGRSGAGVRYGVFAPLRQLQTGQPLARLRPGGRLRIQCRLLHPRDNPGGTVERSYAGASTWNWKALPRHLDPRYSDYARANASIGLNGVAINNVNASARCLTPEWPPKVQALAGVFQPSGMRGELLVGWATAVQ